MCPARRVDDQVNEHGVTVFVNGPLKGEGYADGAVTPGCAVKQGSEAGEVAQAGAGDEAEVQGWATDNPYSHDRDVFDTPFDLRSDFASGSHVVYNRNVGDRFMAPCSGIDATGVTYTKNTYLKLHANGYQPADAGDTAVARILHDEDHAVTGAAAVEYLLAEWTGPKVIEESA
jgi:hypothetical protein